MTTAPDQLCPGCFKPKGTANPCPHCGFDEAAPRPVQALPLQTLLNNQFVVGRVLGKPGGFGITYLAWDQMLEATVAIKEYLPRELAVRAQDSRTLHPHSSDETELFSYGLEQFLAEARTLAKLDHPNLVRVRQFFKANGTAYLVMDYYQGCSLQEHLDSLPGSRMSEADALALMQPILDGLRAVHAAGFLHRDIKPQNIYLAQTNTGGVRPILLDFGAARQAMGERSRSLSVVISPGYAPFEQYHRKGQQGPATDIYGAAAVLYRMLTGFVPPEATERMAGDDLRPASDFGIRSPISTALTQALAIKSDERPESIRAFQQGLELLVVPPVEQSPAAPDDKQPLTEPSQTHAAPPPDRPRLSRVGLGLLIGTLAGVLIVIALLSQFESPPAPEPVAPSPVHETPVSEPAPPPVPQAAALPADQVEVTEQPDERPAPADQAGDVVGVEPTVPPVDDEPLETTESEPEDPVIEESEVTVQTELLPAETKPDSTAESEPPSPPEIQTESQPEAETPSLSTAVDAMLLATCREHMEKMRYTNPEDNNALLCYRAIQRLDPGNLEAVQALEKMTDFYLDSGRKALRDGDYDRVRDRIERLRRIDSDSPAAAQLEHSSYETFRCISNEDFIPDGWCQPSAAEMIGTWLEFQDQSPTPFHAVGQFDDDNSIDQAWILFRKDRKEWGVFLFRDTKNGITKNQVERFSLSDTSLQEFELIKVPPGRYMTACGKGYWDCGPNEYSEVETKTDSLLVDPYYRGGAFLVFWDGDKFQKVPFDD